eukprot:TRINITY_DN16275_c0_g1_i1.p1 TRINITY_DN16275_c0_g1~~TRINITY_DN16275_c0_g1_i1.p1  ORF type:complete len:524 (-),score=120.91 TRINITY_DN16275_c0_g1_i1:110-1681(-)
MPVKAKSRSAPTAYKAYYLCRLRDLETEIKAEAVRPMTPQESYQRRRMRVPGILDALRPSSSQAARDSRNTMHTSASAPSLLRKTTVRTREDTIRATTLSTVGPAHLQALVKGDSPLESPTAEEANDDDSEQSGSEEFFGGHEVDDDLYEAPPEQQERAAEILRKANFFKDLDEEVLEELPRVARFTEEPKGAVVFRQGDPPSNCWLLVRGEIGFFVGKMTQDSMVSPRQPPSADTEGLKVPWPWEEEQRVLTLEGHSTVSLKSTLGRCAHRGRDGVVFGELALLGDNALRKATAKCLADCEFLTLPASAFMKVKQKLLQLQEEKKQFLAENVPGMKDVPIPGPNDPPHASFFFERLVVEKEHAFLKQGIVEDQALFVVAKGTVELRRRQDKFNEEVCGYLGAGELFGKIPHSSEEPFTAAARTPCEVWQVLGKNFRYLPTGLMDAIVNHMSSMTAKRLKQACVERKFGWDKQQRAARRMRHRKPEQLDMWVENVSNQVQARELQTQLLCSSLGEKTVGRWRN